MKPSFVSRRRREAWVVCAIAGLAGVVQIWNGLSLDGLTTVNFDFVKMYRPETNVVRRPVAGTHQAGPGHAGTGQPEQPVPGAGTGAVTQPAAVPQQLRVER